MSFGAASVVIIVALTALLVTNQATNAERARGSSVRLASRSTFQPDTALLSDYQVASSSQALRAARSPRAPASRLRGSPPMWAPPGNSRHWGSPALRPSGVLMGAGVPALTIAARGVSAQDVAHISDRDEDGELQPDAAALNRGVIIDSTPT